MKDIEWRGEKYLWSKSREFISLRRRAETRRRNLELATDIKDRQTRENLSGTAGVSRSARSQRGLSPLPRLHPPFEGEFTVAKDQYIRLNTGWFSDRSGCYLAAGRPVIIQEYRLHATFRRRPPRLHGLSVVGEIAER